MNDAAYMEKFYIGLAIAGAIVLIAALLLILILVAAKRILKLATAALGIVVNIRKNTVSIWALQSTNSKAIGILDEAGTILGSAGAVAQAFQEAENRI